MAFGHENEKRTKLASKPLEPTARTTLAPAPTARLAPNEDGRFGENLV